MPTNVLGTELKCCCRNPMTGFYRDGFCRTGPEDVGQHTVCVQVTQEFLDFSVLDGNDLVTPRPEWGFPGLKPGDKWCVCVCGHAKSKLNLPFSLFLALRYLKPKRTFLSIITLISVLGVMLGVTVLILVISVMTGFDRELRQKVIDFDAHILVSSEDVLRDWRALKTKIDNT